MLSHILVEKWSRIFNNTLKEEVKNRIQLVHLWGLVCKISTPIEYLEKYRTWHLRQKLNSKSTSTALNRFFKDLGVHANESFVSTTNCQSAVKKTLWVLILIQRDVIPNISLVQQNLECTAEASSHYFVCDMDHFEKLHWRAARKVRGFLSLSYEAGLRKSALFSMFHQPLHRD